MAQIGKYPKPSGAHLQCTHAPLEGFLVDPRLHVGVSIPNSWISYFAISYFGFSLRHFLFDMPPCLQQSLHPLSEGFSLFVRFGHSNAVFRCLIYHGNEFPSRRKIGKMASMYQAEGETDICLMHTAWLYYESYERGNVCR